MRNKEIKMGKRYSSSSLLLFSLSFVFIVFLVVPVSSQDYVIKQTEDYDLKRACFNKNLPCAETFACNVTLTNERTGEVITQDQNMSRQPSYYNISLFKNQTFVPDNYKGIMFCTNGTDSGEDTFDLLITPSGTNDDSIRNIILLSFGFLFSIGIIIFGFNKSDPILVLFGGMGLFVFGLYTLLSGVGNYRNTLTEGTSLIILGLAGYISVRTGMEMMNG